MSKDDSSLFRKMMEGVKPLSDDDKIHYQEKKTPRKKQAQAPIARENSIYLSDYYANPVQSEEMVSFCHRDLPRKSFLPLKQGKIIWEARLDLHGFKPERAKDALIQFIAQQYAKEHRCLLIIHGKGGRSGDTPVLKNLVNQWLPQFPEVLGFHSALPKDGGNGALYLLLRRNKLNFPS